MRKRLPVVGGIACAVGLLLSTAVAAHETPNPDGHVPPNFNYGFEPIGRDTLAGVTDGLYTDVRSRDGYAYVGTYQEPACTRAGVFVVDIDQAIANYGSGSLQGAVVAEIKSQPNTRVNDVTVHSITFQNQERNILIATEEKCGPLNGNSTKQLGQGAISLYDVTDPSKPHALKQNFLDTEVHNTFAGTGDDGRSYLIAVDDLNVNDVIIVDITKPQSPKQVGVTGVGDRLDGSYPQIADDGQLFTGAFAAPLLHDVWVDKVDGRWQAVLSYRDAGFVILDVQDPRNPVVLGDPTYPDPDPIFGISPAEGNGRAAVFGGDQGQYLWAGDEDFDAFLTTIKDADGVPHFATQGDDVPQVGPDNPKVGMGRYVGRACDPIDPAADPTDIAVVQRGDCAFTTKAQNAEAAGYQAVIVFNQAIEVVHEALVAVTGEDDVDEGLVDHSRGVVLVEGLRHVDASFVEVPHPERREPSGDGVRVDVVDVSFGEAVEPVGGRVRRRQPGHRCPTLRAHVGAPRHDGGRRDLLRCAPPGRTTSRPAPTMAAAPIDGGSSPDRD
jgi:hypothetical protein